MVMKQKAKFHAQFARILLGNEIAINNVMDGNLINKICSGGDKIQMITNYVNEIDVRVQGTLIMICPKLNQLMYFKN